MHMFTLTHRLLIITVSTSSPLTVCMVTVAVYSISLSNNAVLNTSKLVKQTTPSYKYSSTSGSKCGKLHMA